MSFPYEYATERMAQTLGLSDYILSTKIMGLNLPHNSIAYKIKENRYKAGLSQRSLENMLCLGRNYLNTLESGKVYPTEEISKELAQIFNLNTKYFYDDYLENRQTIYLKIIKYINQKNITKAELSKKIGVHKDTLDNWLANEVTINRSNYYNIISILNT